MRVTSSRVNSAIAGTRPLPFTFFNQPSFLLLLFCSDDEHADGIPERHRHVCVFLHPVDRCCRGGRHQDVTWQQLGSVRLSRLACTATDLVFPQHLDIRNCHHGVRSIHGCHLSCLVQVQRKNDDVIFGLGSRVPKSYYSCSSSWNHFCKRSEMSKAFLICSGAQRNFAYALVLTLPTDLPSQIFHLFSN